MRAIGRFAMVLGILAPLCGCVSIHEDVRVEEPSRRYDPQNVTQRCDPQPYPSRLIWGLGSRALLERYLGWPVRIESQQQFEEFWSFVNVSTDQLDWERRTRQELDIAQPTRPVVNFNQSMVLAYAFFVQETCRKILPARMATDCLTVFLELSNVRLPEACDPIHEIQVQIFVFPRTQLPLETRWTDDADGDGISNESELKLGTDPLDASSKI